jgi:hypothetical protein
MHMGLSNDPEEHYRAELMSHFILRKIPNTITQECEEVFNKKTESRKLQQTRASMAHITPLEYVAPPVIAPVPAVGSDLGELAPSGKKQPNHEKQGGGDVGDVSLWQASSASTKVAPAAENIELVDMESADAAFEAKIKPAGVSSSRRDLPNATAAGSTKQQSLRDMFCGDPFVLAPYGVTRSESTAAYDLIVGAGCNSAQDLVTYLNENKDYKVCNCNNSQRERSPHEENCSSRVAGAWLDGLLKLKIPAFHAVKIILALKKDLK